MNYSFLKIGFITSIVLSLAACMGGNTAVLPATDNMTSGVIEVGNPNNTSMATLQRKIEQLLLTQKQDATAETNRQWEEILSNYMSLDGRFEAAVLTVMANNELRSNRRQSFFDAADRLCAAVDRYSVRVPETEFILILAGTLSNDKHSCPVVEGDGRISQVLNDLMAEQ